MRATVLTLLSCLIFMAAPARSEEPPSKPEEQAAAKPEPVPAAAEKAEQEVFVPPDGWRPKKRGNFTVYCRKDQAMGTRFPKETCYDEAGIRAMLAAQIEDREKVDQMRRICAGDTSCGSR